MVQAVHLQHIDI